VDSDLPPNLERLAALIDQQPPRVREAFHFLLAVALEESGKSRLLNTAQIEGRTHYTYLTVVGDVFTVVRKELDTPEREQEVRTMVAIILGEGSSSLGDKATRGELPPGLDRLASFKDEQPVSSQKLRLDEAAYLEYTIW